MSARREPCLHVWLPFEGEPAVRVEAESEGDEDRLLFWLFDSRWAPLLDALLQPLTMGTA